MLFVKTNYQNICETFNKKIHIANIIQRRVKIAKTQYLKENYF